VRSRILYRKIRSRITHRWLWIFPHPSWSFLCLYSIRIEWPDRKSLSSYLLSCIQTSVFDFKLNGTAKKCW